MCPTVPVCILGVSRRAGGPSAQLGYRKGYPSIVVDVLRGDLLPTTDNIELPKIELDCFKGHAQFPADPGQIVHRCRNGIKVPASVACANTS